jgi:hypothetical protein
MSLVRVTYFGLLLLVACCRFVLALTRTRACFACGICAALMLFTIQYMFLYLNTLTTLLLLTSVMRNQRD